MGGEPRPSAQALRVVGADEGTSAGIYIWPPVEAARKAHNDEWREAVKTRSGGSPLIDNEHRRVTEWAADGKARELDAA